MFDVNWVSIVNWNVAKGRDVWRDIVMQAKAHPELQSHWMMMMMIVPAPRVYAPVVLAPTSVSAVLALPYIESTMRF